MFTVHNVDQELLESLEHGCPHQTCSGDGQTVVSDLLVGEGGQEVVGCSAVLWSGGVDVRPQVRDSVTMVQLHNQTGSIRKTNLQS